VDGKPEQKLKAGDSFETQPMTIHDACSVSGTKLVDTWVIERGKPLAPGELIGDIRSGISLSRASVDCGT
jgi:hypothetical protein